MPAGTVVLVVVLVVVVAGGGVGGGSVIAVLSGGGTAAAVDAGATPRVASSPLAPRASAQPTMPTIRTAAAAVASPTRVTGATVRTAWRPRPAQVLRLVLTTIPVVPTVGPADEQLHRIGDVAEAVGLSLRTIRYYEEVGLVPPTGRSSGGFRLYTDADIRRLALVKQLKPLELTIEEIRDLLDARDRLASPDTPAPERRELVDRLRLFSSLAAQRAERLREHLQAAEAMQDMLQREIGAADRRSQRQRRAR